MVRNKFAGLILLFSIIFLPAMFSYVYPQMEKKVRINGTPEKLSIKIKDADLRDFLLSLAELGRINMIIDPAVKGRVTLFLNNVTWREALDAALFLNDLAYIEISDNSIVGSYEKMKTMAGRLDEVLAEFPDIPDSEDEVITLAYPMTFMDAKDFYSEIHLYLSEKGKFQYNEKTGCAQVVDLKKNAEKIMDHIAGKLENNKRLEK